VKQTIKWNNYEETNNKWNFVLKSIIEMFQGNEILWYSSTDIIILIEDSGKTSDATRKNRGKQKFVDLDCV